MKEKKKKKNYFRTGCISRTRIHLYMCNTYYNIHREWVQLACRNTHTHTRETTRTDREEPCPTSPLHYNDIEYRHRSNNNNNNNNNNRPAGCFWRRNIVAAARPRGTKRSIAFLPPRSIFNFYQDNAYIPLYTTVPDSKLVYRCSSSHTLYIYINYLGTRQNKSNSNARFVTDMTWESNII